VNRLVVRQGEAAVKIYSHEDTNLKESEMIFTFLSGCHKRLRCRNLWFFDRNWFRWNDVYW